MIRAMLTDPIFWGVMLGVTFAVFVALWPFLTGPARSKAKRWRADVEQAREAEQKARSRTAQAEEQLAALQDEVAGAERHLDALTRKIQKAEGEARRLEAAKEAARAFQK
ncbi:MAG: hypothetical protein LC667_14725 [Thioalkalivibrio sp.]|nr:hypothetical protein [Thioalkalivibrio sp.]